MSKLDQNVENAEQAVRAREIHPSWTFESDRQFKGFTQYEHDRASVEVPDATEQRAADGLVVRSTGDLRYSALRSANSVDLGNANTA